MARNLRCEQNRVMSVTIKVTVVACLWKIEWCVRITSIVKVFVISCNFNETFLIISRHEVIMLINACLGFVKLVLTIFTMLFKCNSIVATKNLCYFMITFSWSFYRVCREKNSRVHAVMENLEKSWNEWLIFRPGKVMEIFKNFKGHGKAIIKWKYTIQKWHFGPT